MTEVYVPDSNSDADKWPQAVDVAENIHNGLVVGNLNAYVWWYIRRSYGLLKENGNISKRGYCMAQYSKFVRPGDIRIDATEQPANGVYVSAYKSTDKVTIVAVNKGSDVSQEFSLKNGEKIKNVDRYRTTGSENLAGHSSRQTAFPHSLSLLVTAALLLILSLLLSQLQSLLPLLTQTVTSSTTTLKAIQLNGRQEANLRS